MSTAPALPGTPRSELHRLLTDHHRDVERACRDLLHDTYGDDARELDAAWRRFEQRLLEHMAAEEDLILDAYARVDPDHAREIRRQHDELRALLTPLCLEVQLHVIRARTVEQLIAALRAHAAHEDRAMYPWAERNLPADTQRQLIARLER
jgi:Hemerythrin HHE cation binding domain